ncbi:PP2C family protein-serine/threonine phosphatase [Streptomyces sp. NPDC059896]|uniref:PP2C family protein-serine/threonine phosphatase n=1 Tax=Streptomyces sp. NPDC059896 TaxID=3346993 RepID=UPI003647B722
MPSPLFADRPAPGPTEPGTVDALITRTRRLRGDVAAVRRDTEVDDDGNTLGRWQRALCDLAVRQLDQLGSHLDQLKAGRPNEEGARDRPARDASPDQGSPQDGPGPRLGRVGSGEWNLLTDEVSWSDELFRILGREPESGPLTLDELPSLVFPDDQTLLTAMVTDCLIDGKPIDGEFRIVAADSEIRTLHMMGEPVLDTDGCTASMWAVIRDISVLRDGERSVRDSRDSLRREHHLAQAEHRLVAELHEAVLPAWHGSSYPPGSGPGALDLAARRLPATAHPATGGHWFDTLELPCGGTLLTIGELTGRGVAGASSMAMLLGALRGMAVAGIAPGALLGHLNQLLESSEQPALGSALCSRYDPETRILSWAQAGHPAPLLFRDGTGHALTPPDGVLLGATSGAAYEQAEVQLLPGDLLVLHTDGPTRERLVRLAPRAAGTRSARECAQLIAEESDRAERADGACLMVVRIPG